jgi:hypothetical protein
VLINVIQTKKIVHLIWKNLINCQSYFRTIKVKYVRYEIIRLLIFRLSSRQSRITVDDILFFKYTKIYKDVLSQYKKEIAVKK